jgi:hypothetical protein
MVMPAAGRMSRCVRWLSLLLCATAGPAGGGVAGRMQEQAASPKEHQSPKEYQVKAVFLFRFAQFVEWPPSAFPEPHTPLVIGVLGQDPFGTYLDEIVQGETVNDHPLAVQRYATVEEITTCHILFISRSEDDRLERVLVGLKGRDILTVGDVERFSARGGMIRFVTEHGRIRLRINLKAAEAANLKLSSKLLRPAEIVSPGNE